MPKKIREPADPSTGPVAEFGFRLRKLRQDAGMTYAAVAQASFFSKSAVHALDQGHTLPSASTLKGFVTACGDDPTRWLAERKQLAEQRAASKDVPEKVSLRDQGLPPPDPSSAATAVEYNDALKSLREWSGLTYKQIEEASSGTRRVAPSTLCGAFKRGTLPARDLVTSFLQAIGLPAARQQAWLDTWQAIKDGKRAPVATPLESTAGATAPPVCAPSDEPPDETDDVFPGQDLLPTQEIRDWRFVGGQWHAIDGGGVPIFAPPARSRLPEAVALLLAVQLPLSRRRKLQGAAALLLVAVALLALVVFMGPWVISALEITQDGPGVARKFALLILGIPPSATTPVVGPPCG